jgi:hypothetical protein
VLLRIQCAGFLVLLAAQAGWAQGWLVTPARQELLVRPGETRTYVVRLEREALQGSSPEPVRFTAAPGDWDINRAGDVQLAPAQSLPQSACGWMTYSPAGFSLAPGGRRQVRVSISVPPETPPGVYRAGLFFEEHSVLPPRSDQASRLAIRYRMSSLIYVMVPPLEKKVAVREVEMTGLAAGGLVLRAVLDNLGIAHLRPQHWVEVRDAAGQLLLRTEPTPTMVLLPGRELEVQLRIPQELPGSGPFQVRYLVDVGRDLPLQVTRLNVVASQ